MMEQRRRGEAVSFQPGVEGFQVLGLQLVEAVVPEDEVDPLKRSFQDELGAPARSPAGPADAVVGD